MNNAGKNVARIVGGRRLSGLISLAAIICLASFGSGQQLNHAGRASPDEQFALAAGHYERREWTDAAEGFSQFLESSPGHPRSAGAWFYRGESLMQAGQLEPARAAYLQYLVAEGDRSLAEQASFRVAEIAARNDEREAVPLLEKFLQTWPRSAWREFALYYLGHQRLARGEPQLARKVLESALAEFPNSPLAGENLLGTGIACRQLGDLDAARGCFERLIPVSTGPLQQGAELQLAGVLILEERHSAAAPLLIALTESDDLPPSLAGEAWLLHGLCQRAADDIEASASSFKQAVAVAQDDDLAAVAVWQLALACEGLGNAAEAAEQLDRLLGNWPEHRLVPMAAAMRIELHSREQAWEKVAASFAANERHWKPGAMRTRVEELFGQAAYELERFAECERTFEGLLDAGDESDPARRGTWLYYIGASQIGLQHFAEAEKTLRMIDLDRLSPERRTVCLFAQARAALGSGDTAGARPLLQQLEGTSADPGLARDVRHELLRLLVADEDWTAAGRELDGYMAEEDSSPRSMELVAFIGQASHRAGNRKLARCCIEGVLAVDQCPSGLRTEALSTLAWIELEEGHGEAALQQFGNLVHAFPDSDATRRAWIAMALLLEQKQDWPESARMYGLAAESAPDVKQQHSALFKQAVMLRKAGDPWSITRGGELIAQLVRESSGVVPPAELAWELAWYDLRRGNGSAAQAGFESIATTAPGSPLWPDAALRTARARIEADATSPARDLLEQILVADAVPPLILQQASYLLGKIEAESSNWARSSELMSSALATRADPALDPQCRYWLAESQYRLRDFVPALDGFSRLARDGTTGQTLAPWIALRHCQCLAALNRWEEVATAADSGRQQFATFDRGWEFILLAAKAAFASGRYDDAMQAFAEVIATPAARGTDLAAEAEWLTGEALFHQEKYRAAIAAYYRVDSLYQSPYWRAAALLQAGKCQELLGNRKHAEALYRQLLEKFGDSQHVDTARKRLDANTSTTADRRTLDPGNVAETR